MKKTLLSMMLSLGILAQPVLHAGETPAAPTSRRRVRWTTQDPTVHTYEYPAGESLKRHLNWLRAAQNDSRYRQYVNQGLGTILQKYADQIAPLSLNEHYAEQERALQENDSEALWRYSDKYTLIQQTIKDIQHYLPNHPYTVSNAQHFLWVLDLVQKQRLRIAQHQVDQYLRSYNEPTRLDPERFDMTPHQRVIWDTYKRREERARQQAQKPFYIRWYHWIRGE